jgi:DNA-binding NarL/FixJ family response regulator
MDIAMPLLNGLEATRQIRKEFPDTKVIILSAHSDDAYVEQVIELGAAGFLLKQASSHNLATAVHRVMRRAGDLIRYGAKTIVRLSPPNLTS